MKVFNTFLLIVFAAVLYGQCGTNGLPDYSFDPTDPNVDSKQFAVEFTDVPPPAASTLDYYVAATADGSVVGCGPVGANAAGRIFGNGQIYFNCNSIVPEAITCTASCTDCQDFKVYYFDVSESLFYPIVTVASGTVVREYAFVDTNPDDNIIDGFSALDAASGTTTSTVNTSLANSDFNSFFTNLPVVLSYFYGEQSDKNISLNWGVESEDGNESFVVERSFDGTIFTDVAEVAGRGDSNESFDYSAVDENPAAGANYYRLRQNDFEGSFTYSSVVLVNFDGADAGAMSVSPNPAEDQFSVRLSGNWSAESVSGKLIEASGRLIKDWQQLPGTSTTIDLNGVAAGVYQLMMTDGKNRLVQRVVVR